MTPRLVDVKLGCRRNYQKGQKVAAFPRIVETLPMVCLQLYPHNHTDGEERKLHILTQGNRQKTLSTFIYCRCRKMPRIIKCHSFNCKFLAAGARVPCLLVDSFPVSSLGQRNSGQNKNIVQLLMKCIFHRQP